MRSSITCLLLFACFQVFAQSAKPSKTNIGVITGTLLEDESGKAIPDATISLSLMRDGSGKRSSVTDKNGSFELEALAFGLYRFTATSIGYATVTMDSIFIREERFDFNLGDVKLRRSSAALAEVIVYAEKPLIENKDGKITYNVGESALSSGSSTAELLKSMPMIANDPNGKVLLKGREPKILIDDKPTDLSAAQLADLLESMPGSSIDRIELMLNPPPQYATEAGGVINIVTKKGKIGLVGRVVASGGTRGEGSLSSNMSYRNKKYSFNTTLGLAASQFTGNSYSRRENYYRDSTNFFNTGSRFKNQNLRPNIRLQGEYELDKNNSFNAVFQNNLNYFDNNSFTQYANLNRDKEIYRLSTRENASVGNGYNNSLTLSYTYRGKSYIERLQVIAAGNFGKNDNGRDFYQQFLQPNFLPTGLDSSQNQATDVYSNAYSLRINYDKPLRWKGAMLSTGISYGRNNYHNVLNTSFLKKLEQQFVINELLSTDFRFHQTINTARAGMSYQLPAKWRITAGAQVEQTQFDFTFIKGNAADVNNTYWNLLPNLTIRKEFNKTVNASFVYRRSIRRPGIAELNPSVDYNDPYNIRFGNPNLLPSLAENFDLNIGLSKGKYYFNGSLGYNNVKDIFNTIRSLVEAGKTQVTYQNIAARREYEASFWGGYTFSKKLRINMSAGYSYNQYNAADKLLFKYRNGQTFYTSLNYNYMPNPLTTFEGNARYSSFADPQGRARSNLQLNLGIQRKFFARRLTVGLNAIDPLRVQKYTTYTYGSNFMLENFSSTNTRNFRVSLGWQLNRTQKKRMSEKEKKAVLERVKKKM
ncbi:TonB-dependent receptor [Segetibacter sp. 3557_3]|uniref:TonB-dependent receptor domain-containing protein n=1 Tax=Segetibacter sp. 3557_3 TaxID=2547429 RepID=UPI001058EF1A|nr:TonB-dependent receptor [Segetibacter sp. 3557_3]TDH27359.1 TonB-dependent receptor [Segetibacter sp. 3557_3]